MNQRELISKVRQIISEHNLDSKSRSYENAYPRKYVARYLKTNTKLSDSDIAKMFKQTRTFTARSVKTHDALMDVMDDTYLRYTNKVYMQLIEIDIDRSMNTVKKAKSLISRVLDCKNYLDMVKLQNELNEKHSEISK